MEVFLSFLGISERNGGKFNKIFIVDRNGISLETCIASCGKIGKPVKQRGCHPADGSLSVR
jgi:hypothetical protein